MSGCGPRQRVLSALGRGTDSAQGGRDIGGRLRERRGEYYRQLMSPKRVLERPSRRVGLSLQAGWLVARDDAEWSRALEVIGAVQLAADPRFGSVRERVQNHRELHSRIPSEQALTVSGTGALA